ncbi:MAG: tetratricopeptide repeat protein [Cyanobacteria bacterium SZAS-4]|nr:tetratricopeptide repeat protein [Cyanobacteria bacterium SZAS-4]
MAKKSVVLYSFSALVAASACLLATSSIAVLATPAAVSSSFEEGVRLYGQKQYKQALPVFMQFLEANPRSSAAYLYIANTCYALQQVDSANQTYRILIQSCPNSSEAQSARQFMNLLDAASAQRLDASVSRDLAYYLQKSVAGQHECCGELFGNILGTQDDKSEKMKMAFPQTIKYLKAKLGV